jgi:hypothetical protein
MTKKTENERAALNRGLRGVMRASLMCLGTLSVLTACSDDPVVVTDAPRLNERAHWQAALTGTAAFPAVRGTATIADYSSYFDLQIAITSAAATTPYQWRLYPGTCAAPEAVFYGPVQAYPNLLTNASGAAQLSRTIVGPLNLTGSYNIRVSTVATPVSIVACGNLQH